MNRVVSAELLDTDDGSPSEIAASLQDLEFLNWAFGGEATTLSLLRQVAAKAGRSSLRLLEIGAGLGTVPISARKVLAASGIQLDVTLLDRVPVHLNRNERCIVGDALALPFRGASFDVVSCCLFAHHLEPDEILTCVNEALRVSKVAVLINDLVRHRLHFALACAARAIYRSRITCHDAPASVRRAYTVNEMRRMLAETRATRVEVQQRYFYRMGAIAWKH